MKKLVLFLVLTTFSAHSATAPQRPLKLAKATPAHGIAMHGTLKYKKDFKNFDYVNPNAPKGGALRLSAFGSFDTFNPYVIKGLAAAGIGMTYDTLTVGAEDEPFSEYGLVAETIEVPKDRSYVIFNLRKEARFHDGKQITADDVVFSFELLRDKGLPMYRHYFGNVDTAMALSPLRVLFKFKEGENRELPLILGQMPILPKHYWEGRDFTKTTLEPPLTSGPYRVKSFEVGRNVVYERVPDYWAQNLPVMKGTNNFDTVIYDYYRDTTVAVEAFKSGAFDLRFENEAKRWANAYNIPAVETGALIKREFSHSLPSGMQGFVFNTRRGLFKDINVRKALALAFDFEWSNKTLFYGLYQRTQSYFDNSELRAWDYPKGGELKLLEQYRKDLPPEVFDEPFSVAKTDGSGDNRTNLLRAAELLKKAGWTVENGVLQNGRGEPFRFEILLNSTSGPAWERISLPYVKNLKRLGIETAVRTVDLTQYKNRLDHFDFDMIVHVWGQSLSPGNEQRYFWGTEASKMPGSHNYAGIESPIVDALIERLIESPDRAALVERTRALDRVLVWSYYVVPHWFSPVHRYVYWNRFGVPDGETLKGVQLMTWWVDPDKENILNMERKEALEAKKADRKTLYRRLIEWF